jgi:hypothetical protein
MPRHQATYRRVRSGRRGIRVPGCHVTRGPEFGYNRVVRVLALALVWMTATACGGREPATTGGPPPAVVTLQPSAENASEPAVVHVPPDAAQVQIRLAGLTAPAQELTAELERVGGDQIRRWSVDDVTSDPTLGSHAVTVPIYEVRPGEYVVTIWAGDADIVQRYRFRVQTP